MTGCLVGAGSGAVLGGLVTLLGGGVGSFPAGAVGCFTGAVDAILIGYPGSFSMGGLAAVITIQVSLNSLQATYDQAMKACNQIP